jgi:hypothetical protein
MTSNTTPEGAVSASGFNSTNFSWYAFDNNFSTYWQSGIGNSGSIAYQFSSSKIIKQYAFYSFSTNGNNPRNWVFEGSNDNITYTIIETVTGFTTAINTWYVRDISSNVTSYTWYRMRIDAVQTTSLGPVIRQLNMTELTSSAYSTGNSGSFISGGDIQISASAQVADGFFGLHPIGSINTVSFFTITGSHNVGITGSVAAAQGGSVSNRRGILISNGGTLGVIGDLIPSATAGGTSNNIGILCSSGSVTITGSIRARGQGNTGSSPLLIVNGTASFSGSINSITFATPIALATGTAQVNIIATPIINGTSTRNMQIGGINSGTLNYIGPVIGNNTAGIQLTGGAMNVNISGSISTIGAASGFTTAGIGTVTVNGSITSGNAAPGLQSTQAGIVRVTGPLISQNNYPALYAQRTQLLSNSTPYYTLQSDTFNKDVIFYDTSFTSSLPAQTDVRSGSLYGGTNEYSGSMVVPSTGSVRYGVPVDNTTGSAILTPQDILTYAVSSLTGSNSIGARLQNIATVQTTAATIAAFKGK